MPRRLSPDVMLSITLDAICSRNRYTTDPAPVVAELYATAGDRLDILTESVGTWVGFFEDAEILTLCTALREIPGLEPWITVGTGRRSLPHHSTPPLGIRHGVR
ncbi:hypothetical protein QE375_000948 [Microbacterium foliorum]|uniref:Uncharacterized protein n=1 Tax=Microbacterium foliorum TaxID=104336 RepID=A0ABU1HPY2_9MICO|nr:hypothetical protein [Microbacterium foliorum]MDR6141394.1 hypothetical protein [Microbacterium foliorum]